MAAVPRTSTLLVVLTACALIAAVQLLWNRYLNHPLFSHEVTASRASQQQWKFEVPFTSEYELWLEFAKGGSSDEEWKRLFGFGVPPAPGVPVHLTWEIRIADGSKQLATGDVRSTYANAFSGPVVGRLIGRIQIPKGMHTFRAEFIGDVPELERYPASLRLVSEPTTSPNWRFALYWVGSYALVYVVLPVAFVAVVLIAARYVAA